MLSEENKLGIPLNKIRQMHEDEKRRVEVKKRRHEETVKREKLSYWHLIKRDVLKYKKEIATQDAH